MSSAHATGISKSPSSGKVDHLVSANGASELFSAAHKMASSEPNSPSDGMIQGTLYQGVIP